MEWKSVIKFSSLINEELLREMLAGLCWLLPDTRQMLAKGGVRPELFAQYAVCDQRLEDVETSLLALQPQLYPTTGTIMTLADLNLIRQAVLDIEEALVLLDVALVLGNITPLIGNETYPLLAMMRLSFMAKHVEVALARLADPLFTFDMLKPPA